MAWGKAATPPSTTPLPQGLDAASVQSTYPLLARGLAAE